MYFRYLNLEGCEIFNLLYFFMEIVDDLYVNFFEKLKFIFQYMYSLFFYGIILNDILVNYYVVQWFVE